MSVAALVSVRVVLATVCVTYRLRFVPVMSTGLAPNATPGTAQAHQTAPAEVSLAFAPTGLEKSTHLLLISSRISCRTSINFESCNVFFLPFTISSINRTSEYFKIFPALSHITIVIAIFYAFLFFFDLTAVRCWYKVRCFGIFCEADVKNLTTYIAWMTCK